MLRASKTVYACFASGLPEDAAPLANERTNGGGQHATKTSRILDTVTSRVHQSSQMTSRVELSQITITSTHRCCAERRLLAACERDGQRHGYPKYQRGAWIRRKYGTTMAVWRTTADGYGCSLPCVLCAKALERLAMRVVCVGRDGKACRGALCELPDKPQPTGMQRRTLFAAP